MFVAVLFMFKGQSILNAIVGLVSLLFSNNKLAPKVYECILSIFMKFKNDLSYFPFFFYFFGVCVCVFRMWQERIR